MRLMSNSFTVGTALPNDIAFAVINENNLEAHIALGENRNSYLAWSDVPIGTKSFVLICYDPDVPSKVTMSTRRVARCRRPYPG